MANEALAGVGGFLQGLSSVLVPAQLHKERIAAADQLAKNQQKYKAIVDRVKANHDLLRNPAFMAEYRNAMGIGEGKSDPEVITQLLAQPSSAEVLQQQARQETMGGGGTDVSSLLGDGTGAASQPPPTSLAGPGSSAEQLATDTGAPLPDAVTAPEAPTAPGGTLSSRIAAMADKPGGIATLGLAFGDKIAKLSVAEKKLTAQAAKDNRPKTIFKEFKTGDRVQSFAIHIQPDGSFSADRVFDAPRFKSSLPGAKEFKNTNLNAALIANGVSPDAIRTGSYTQKDARKAITLLKQRKESWGERIAAELTARRDGKPAGTGDPRLRGFTDSELKKKAVGGQNSFLNALMDDEDAATLAPPPAAAAAPAAAEPTPAAGTVQPFVAPGYPGAGPAGLPITIKTVRKK